MYSVGTSNRYAAFMDDEDDPGDIISPPEKETPTTKTSKVKETGKQIKSSKGKENKDKAAQKQNKVVVLENVNKSEFLLAVSLCGWECNLAGAYAHLASLIWLA